MLQISLVVVGEKMPDWVTRGYLEYEKRIRGRTRLQLVEIPAGKRGKNADIPRIIQTEEQKIRGAIPQQAHIIALDRIGKSWSTIELSQRMQNWIDSGDQIALVVGGPEGLSDQFIQSANETWSLSSLTFAHPLVRVLLAEQLYRCHSILEGSPYHR
jgi:23S rRNA (pseudouridine1915-N3)-methyltransferase